MALVHSSPSQERLGRVVELLRGVEWEPAPRRPVDRRGRRRAVRPPTPTWPSNVAATVPEVPPPAQIDPAAPAA